MDRLQLEFSSWLNSTSHHQWLAAEATRLLEFAKAARLAEGFGYLDEHGKLTDTPAQTLITTRMTHSFALAHLQGLPGFAALVDHGVAALKGCLRDSEHGGWYAVAGHADGDSGKAAYLHAFVALAASSAVVAGRPGAQALLEDAVAVIERHFWAEEEGAMREAFDQAWSQQEAYRGANSNMHSVEAFLALADATGESRWLSRALRICERIIHGQAAGNGYRVIEHFSGSWAPLLDYNHAQPADPFRPYGSTPGHAFEWARLLLHLEAALSRAGLAAPAWLSDDARQLFDTACRTAWHVDGAEGIVYTLDWNDDPVVRQRMHWVHAEAIAAAAALLRRTAEPTYEHWYRLFWEYTEARLVDRELGSWHHELDPQNRPSAQVWGGKPDLYHALQAVLLPRLPLAPSLASAVRSM
ncbi:AGE family epimerase/isomerase [Pseudomonas sp. RIT-PI-S]|uniref:D-mannose isomerase n=1 Tax=Pseudomonas sp. RIT-PI-S TaxID=3035295 RepID=UPI0021DA2232|nr:AGE family epimerase/isomerase [Pseudomonas sp. RIT-PI-S]